MHVPRPRFRPVSPVSQPTPAGCPRGRNVPRGPTRGRLPVAAPVRTLIPALTRHLARTLAPARTQCRSLPRTLPGSLVLALTLVGAPAAAEFAPNWKPAVNVPSASGPIEIDGELEDAGWRGAARADNFCEANPGDQIEPGVASEVWITYDENNLYLAFLASDDGAAVRASLSDRDEIFQDDYFGIILDTYGDAAWAYEFFVNPLGIQGDLRWTPNGEDINFDVVWHSRGKVTAGGYQVEVAIPFSSLRFPDVPVQTWRATFWRDRQRDSRYRYSWAAIDRDDACWPCNFGTLTGMGDVRGGSSLDLIPSLVAGQSSALRDFEDPNSGLERGDVDVEASVNMRYAISNSFSAEGAVNPDFSQVESDAAQIDVNSTFALFFPERRPFFLDGQDLFDTWINAVYTRSINDPSGAVKLLGRMDGRNVAVLSAVDETSPILLPFEERSSFVGGDRSWSNIARFRQSFLEDSHVGLLVTDRRFEGGGSGSFVGGDGQVRFLDNYRLEFQGAISNTEEPDDTTLTADLNGATFDAGDHTAAFDGESFAGHAYYLSLERDARLWSFDVDYWEYSPTFRASNGFVTRNDSREAVVWSGLFFHPNNAFLDEVTPMIRSGWRWNFEGVRKTAWVYSELNLQFKKQTAVSLGWTYDTERFRNVDFDRMHRFAMEVESNFSEAVQVGCWSEFGDYIARNRDPAPVLGDGLNVEAWGTLRPFSRLRIQPGYSYSELEGPDGDLLFSGYVVRARTSYQFSRELFMRLVLQYNSFSDQVNIEPLVTYKVNPFTAVYLGSTHRYEELENPRTRTTDYTQTDRQFFAKVQVLFQQ